MKSKTRSRKRPRRYRVTRADLLAHVEQLTTRRGMGIFLLGLLHFLECGEVSRRDAYVATGAAGAKLRQWDAP